ncbi:MAG: type II toxin-antitoxin system RelB/DinJ family antitoxin [Pseudomonadaceae bacterium]
MAAVLKTTDVRCRIEEDLKESATAVLHSCGLSVSDAMRLFLRQVVELQGLPFQVRVPSKKTIAAMNEARSGNLPRFNSIDDLMADLDADD